MSSSSSNSKYEQVLEEIYQSTITMLRKSKPHMNDDLLKFIAQDLIRVATKRLADSKNSDETGVLCTLNDILQRRFPSQTNESDQPKSPEVTTPPKEQDETLNKNHKRKCCDDSSKSCYSDSAYNSRSSSRQSGVTKQEKFDNKFKLCQNKNTSSFKRNNSSNSLKSNSSSSFSQRRASVCGKPEEFNLKTSRECLFGSPLTALDVFRYKQLEKKVKLSQERRQAEGNVFERLYRDSQKPKNVMVKRKQSRIQEMRRTSDRQKVFDQNSSVVSTESVVQLEFAINHLSIKHNN